MEAVDAMLLAGLRDKAIKWRKAAEAYEQEESTSDIEDISDTKDLDLKDNETKSLPNKEESDNAYFELVKHCNQQSQLEDGSSPSLLLPAYAPPLEEINIQVKGNDVVKNGC